MRLVRAYGGTRFEMIWGDHGLQGVRFAIQTEHGEVPVRLGARVERVAEIIGGDENTMKNSTRR